MENRRSLTLNRVWLAVLSIGLAYALINPAGTDVTAEDLASVRATAEDVASVRASVAGLDEKLSTVESSVALLRRDADALASDVYDMYFESLQNTIDNPSGVDFELRALSDCLNEALFALESNMNALEGAIESGFPSYVSWIVPRC